MSAKQRKQDFDKMLSDNGWTIPDVDGYEWEYNYYTGKVKYVSDDMQGFALELENNIIGSLQNKQGVAALKTALDLRVEAEIDDMLFIEQDKSKC